LFATINKTSFRWLQITKRIFQELTFKTSTKEHAYSCVTVQVLKLSNIKACQKVQDVKQFTEYCQRFHNHALVSVWACRQLQEWKKDQLTHTSSSLSLQSLHSIHYKQHSILSHITTRRFDDELSKFLLKSMPTALYTTAVHAAQMLRLINTRKPSQRKGERATALVYRTQLTKSPLTCILHSH